MDLKPDFISGFIDLYRKYPCLWMVKHENYSNKRLKDEAYAELEKYYQRTIPTATVDTVKKKINNLRSAFRKELKKVKNAKSSGSADEEYTPTLWYYDQLLFSADQEDCKSTNGTEEIYLIPATSPSTFTEPTPEDNSFVPSSRKRKSAPSSHDLLTNKTTGYLDADEDDFLILAKGYAVKLRKLTQQQAMLADKLINETLFDAHMGFLTRGSYLVHPDSEVKFI